MDWYTEIVRDEDGEVVSRMGPNTRKTADVIADGAFRNLDHERYYVRVVQGGTDATDSE